MNRPDLPLNAAALILGLILAPTRMALMFFPLFNVGEVLLFGGAAAALSYFYRAKPAWWVVLLFLPVFLLTLHAVVFWLGADQIRRGVGTGHALSLLLIPLSSFAGAHFGARAAHGRPPTH